MKYIFYITMMFLYGCGQAPKPIKVDPFLAPYLDSFKQDIGVDPEGISVNFANTEDYNNPLGETIGECIIDEEDNTRTIQIDKDYWDTASLSSKQELMYHELGHCALALQHINTTKTDTCPTSIMNAYEFGESPCYMTETVYYLNELKSHANLRSK